MSDGDDNLIKIPFRGAAPAQAATLIAAASPPPPDSWVLEVPFSDADVILSGRRATARTETADEVD